MRMHDDTDGEPLPLANVCKTLINLVAAELWA